MWLCICYYVTLLIQKHSIIEGNDYIIWHCCEKCHPIYGVQPDMSRKTRTEYVLKRNDQCKYDQICKNHSVKFAVAK